MSRVQLDGLRARAYSFGRCIEGSGREALMDSSRVSVRAAAEWVVAAAILAILVGGGTVAFREFRTVAAVMPVIARDAGAQVPTATVPDRAVSVPMLLLGDNMEIRVGDAATAVLPRLSAGRELQPPSAERGPHGVRETRAFAVAGTQFVLVLEPFDHDPAMRVAAIYLH
jgi:hypothetical protein